MHTSSPPLAPFQTHNPLENDVQINDPFGLEWVIPKNYLFF